jgi:hypothetical protein
MRSLHLFVILLSVGTWSCASECTEKGCLNTTTFVFVGLGGVPVEGAVGAVTMGTRVTEFDCGPMGGGDGSAYRCIENAVVIYGRENAAATVSVRSANGSLRFDGQITLQFTSVFPNGEGCPGECRSSTENPIQLMPTAG